MFNYDYIDDVRYRYIKNRMGENVTSLLSNIKKRFPTSKIYLVGSVIDFTFLKKFSDVDCCIQYSNKNDEIEITKYIYQQENIKSLNKVIFKHTLTLLDKTNIINVYRCIFDNGEKLDINLIDYNALPIEKGRYASKGVFTKTCHYILKICNKHKLINKKKMYKLKNHPLLTYDIHNEFGKYENTVIDNIKII